MKACVLSILLLYSPLIALPQNKVTDSLQLELALAKQDTSRVLILADLALLYRTMKPDSAFLFGQQALALARRINFIKGESRALVAVGFTHRELGDLPKAMQLFLEALRLAESHNLSEEAAFAQIRIGYIYFDLKDWRTALYYFKLAWKKYRTFDSERPGVALSLTAIGDVYQATGELDSAFHYTRQAYQAVTTLNSTEVRSVVLRDLGILEFRSGHTRTALQYYQQSLKVVLQENNHRSGASTYHRLAEAYKKLNKNDSSLYFARKALAEASLGPFPVLVLRSSQLLAQLYESENPQEALRYHKLATAAADSLYGARKFQQLQLLILNDQQRHQELMAAQKEYKSQVRFYAVLAGLGVVLLAIFILWRNNRQKQRANELLHNQKEEISFQRNKAEQALIELKATQAQLLQREKMASLGELTAGIAHEIQNPLNFVNNLSEVSTELVDELVEEAKVGHTDDVLELAGDLREMLEKVNHHGKRADSIVKGMLLHSRASSSDKQPTDLNALADEYLRLAYHGLRAKDKDFNADLWLNLDANLTSVNIAPQEMGRVLLNLYNNAFYAMQQRQKQEGNGYVPRIEVTTHADNGKVALRVKDNGTGIPQAIITKIYNPFFTTKPTGQGTGLGLSLSYDIVTKGHGGELTVESEEGQGTAFIIILPTEGKL